MPHMRLLAIALRVHGLDILHRKVYANENIKFATACLIIYRFCTLNGSQCHGAECLVWAI